jgi:transcriptional regulator with XRE-family HTH domain
MRLAMRPTTVGQGMTPAQCRMARAALGRGVREAATLSGVSPASITRFERGHSPGTGGTQERLRKALEIAGVMFIDSNGEGPGVRLRKGS